MYAFSIFQPLHAAGCGSSDRPCSEAVFAVTAFTAVVAAFVFAFTTRGHAADAAASPRAAITEATLTAAFSVAAYTTIHITKAITSTCSCRKKRSYRY
jgi:hypothetical protein